MTNDSQETQSLATLILPSSCFHSFFTTAHLFSLNLNKRMNKLLTYDTYRYPLTESRKIAIEQFNKLAQKDVFALATEKVYEDYLKELRVRNSFKCFLYVWRVKRAVRKFKDATDDPITFMPIEKPVYVYDMKLGRRFVFEATTLAKSIRKNLYAQQYTLPQPKCPINVYTNKPFTAYQLMSIQRQMKQYPVSADDLTFYSRNDFNIEKWKMYMSSHLHVAAVREELYDLQSETGQDMIVDYILDTMYALNYTPRHSFSKLIVKIVEWWPDHPIICMIRSICMKSYEADHFNMNIKPILYMRFKTAIDSLWPKSELLDMAMERFVSARGELIPPPPPVSESHTPQTLSESHTPQTLTPPSESHTPQTVSLPSLSPPPLSLEDLID